MPGHRHHGDPSLTQNQGNLLGDRPCVRQSRLYREHVGGNAMKELMGQDVLKWDTTRTQGAYDGGKVFDDSDARAEEEEVVIAIDGADDEPHTPCGPRRGDVSPERRPQERRTPVASRGFRKGAGHANRQTYNIFTGE